MSSNAIKELSVVETLMTLDGGGTMEEVQSAIVKVAEAVRFNGGSGSVTLKLTFKQSGKKNNRQMSVADSVSCTLPKVLKDDTVFFVTDTGNLSRSNPDQGAFAGLEAGN